jgi:hypothetical protein
VRKADNLPPSCADVKKSGARNFLEPCGPVQACNGTALALVSDINVWHVSFTFFFQFFPVSLFPKFGDERDWYLARLARVYYWYQLCISCHKFLISPLSCHSKTLKCKHIPDVRLQYTALKASVPFNRPLVLPIFTNKSLVTKSWRSNIKSVLKENSLPIFRLSQTVPYVCHPAVAILSVMCCKLCVVVNVQNYADIGSHLWLWRKFGEVWNLLRTIITSPNLSWPVRSDKGGIIICDIAL